MKKVKNDSLFAIVFMDFFYRKNKQVGGVNRLPIKKFIIDT